MGEAKRRHKADTSRPENKRKDHRIKGADFAEPNGNYEWRRFSPRVSAGFAQARASDKRWFSDNPRRSHRIRKAIKDELPSLVGKQAIGQCIVVRQFEPGCFVRRIFGSDNPPENNEANAHTLFDIIGELQRMAPPGINSVEIPNQID